MPRDRNVVRDDDVTHEVRTVTVNKWDEVPRPFLRTETAEQILESLKGLLQRKCRRLPARNTQRGAIHSSP